MDCPFCKLVKQGLPDHCIYEDNNFFVILDKGSLGFGHCMVIPKEHKEKIYELEDDKYTSLFSLAKNLTQKLLKITNKKAVAYMAFGSGLPHAHLHLVPHDDQDVLINPMKYLRKLTDEELKKEADEIKINLNL